ncbi:hypothetical protein B0H13DRAFT_2393350 [Mycena leptocephala]|nr:hypothetical protein B0H13DRAFT_2393350 [Mycena leptocephala]
MGKGTGDSIPYSEVLFLDGAQPSVAVPAQPAQGGQPAIRTLTFAQAGQYLTGHGVAPLPNATTARHRRIAQCIGCIATIWAKTTPVLFLYMTVPALMPYHIDDNAYVVAFFMPGHDNLGLRPHTLHR